MMREAAPAKVNLFLHVTGKRPDGYHVLDSLAVFAGAADIVSAEPAAELRLRVEGPFAAGLGNDGDNLVLRAAEALRRAAGTDQGAVLTLEKNLPVASGIGGGSADAAAALRLLAQLWRVAVPRAELAGIAAGLGADVPACLLSEPTRMGGVGELLGIAPAVPECGMLLVNPGVAVSTPAVFKARNAGFSSDAVLPAGWDEAAAMAADLATLGNDLEAPARALCPQVDEVLGFLHGVPGVLLARMSGSGATCFGLFATVAEAERARALVPEQWWAWGGGLRSGAGAA